MSLLRFWPVEEEEVEEEGMEKVEENGAEVGCGTVEEEDAVGLRGHRR